MSELSDSEKAVYRAATERRKANGIRLKRFTILAEETQVEALNEVFESWIVRWGKNLAIDHLIVIMAQIEARQRDRERARRSGETETRVPRQK